MALLILGLVLFLGAHSTRIFAENWRQATLERLGEKGYKGVYTLVSLLGFGLMMFGFDQVRWDSPVLWSPPVWAKHGAALLMLVSLVLLACVYSPRNAIKAKLHHPMVLSVKVWALAHLLANPRLADVVLFGAFLLWSVLNEPPASVTAWPPHLCPLAKAVDRLSPRFPALPHGGRLA
jgi:uncharacterized membrane protein